MYLNVLFLCTHNSARSILAEALLNHHGKERFKAYSAGSSPREHLQPNPLAIVALRLAGISTEGLHSKSWDVFSAATDAPQMNLVITVCDNAAGEPCPFWPGAPATAHWGYADPSLAQGDHDAKLAAFTRTLRLIEQRIIALVSAVPASCDQQTLGVIARQLSTS